MKKILLLILIAVALMQIPALSAPHEEIIVQTPLKSKVTVKYDNYGIPHIYASNLHDLMFAQGYVVARDRLFQMDMNRREVNGRMAVLRGKGYVDHDYNIYLTGIPQVSRKIYDTGARDENMVYEAYADGVNAYINGLKDVPAEYKEIGAKPEPWSPVDIIAIGRGVSWIMSSDLGIEVAVGVLLKKVGANMVAPLLPITPLDPVTVIRGKSTSSFPIDKFDERVAAILDEPIFNLGRRNYRTWRILPTAISCRRTTGRPARIIRTISACTTTRDTGQEESAT